MPGPYKPLTMLAWSRWSKWTGDGHFLLAAQGKSRLSTAADAKGIENFFLLFSFSTWTTWTTRTKAGKSIPFVVRVKGSNPDHLDQPTSGDTARFNARFDAGSRAKQNW